MGLNPPRPFVAQQSEQRDTREVDRCHVCRVTIFDIIEPGFRYNRIVCLSEVVEFLRKKEFHY